MTDEWIWVTRWQDFQHYKPRRDRGPAWIKTYTAQLDDDRYLSLTDTQRCLLHDVRILFASQRHRLKMDLRWLNLRLNLKAKMATVEALNHAGLIEIVSREVLEQRLELLYSPSRARSREVEEEEDLYPGVGLDNGHKQQPPDFNIPNLKSIPDESEAW